MKLDWNDMEEVALPHFYGGAKDMKAKAYFDKLNRISLPRWSRARRSACMCMK